MGGLMSRVHSLRGKGAIARNSQFLANRAFAAMVANERNAPMRGCGRNCRGGVAVSTEVLQEAEEVRASCPSSSVVDSVFRYMAGREDG